MADKNQNQRRKKRPGSKSGKQPAEPRTDWSDIPPVDDELEAGDLDVEIRDEVKAMAELTKDEVEIVQIDDDEDVFVIGADADAVIDDVIQYTDDEEIQDEFIERQRLNQGSRQLFMKFHEHHAKTPDLTADDVDAAWEESGVGDETVGGTAPTPDQDIVDEIGEAVGLTYEDNELLNIQEKLMARDRHRWELDPASADSELEELEESWEDEEDEDVDEEVTNRTLQEFEEPEDLEDDELDELDSELNDPLGALDDERLIRRKGSRR